MPKVKVVASHRSAPTEDRELVLRKYDPDLPDECWSVEIDGEELYVLASRGEDGEVTVEPNHGYEPGSEEHASELRLFRDNRKALFEAARTAVSELEESSRSAPRL